MIEYIVRDKFGLLEICEDGLIFKRDVSLMGLLNLWSSLSLRTVETTLKITKKILNCSHKIPLYIDSNLLFLQLRTIRSKTPFLINYYAIAKLLSQSCHKTSIVFKSGITVDFNSYPILKRQMELSNRILKSLESNIQNKKVFT